jgi:hypothetical protein
VGSWWLGNCPKHFSMYGRCLLVSGLCDTRWWRKTEKKAFGQSARKWGRGRLSCHKLLHKHIDHPPGQLLDWLCLIRLLVLHCDLQERRAGDDSIPPSQPCIYRYSPFIMRLYIFILICTHPSMWGFDSQAHHLAVIRLWQLSYTLNYPFDLYALSQFYLPLL